MNYNMMNLFNSSLCQIGKTTEDLQGITVPLEYSFILLTSSIAVGRIRVQSEVLCKASLCTFKNAHSSLNFGVKLDL